MGHYVSLTLNQAMQFVKAAWEADPFLAPILLGPPGIGKTEGVGMITAESFVSVAQATAGQSIRRMLAALEIGHGADEDVGGMPCRDPATGAILRLPIGPLRQWSTEPTALFLDEVSRASGQKQGQLLTIVNEGRAGDFKAHPDSRCVLAANGIESAGAHQIIDTLINRCPVIEVKGDAGEVREYLVTRVGAPGSPLNMLAVDYAATAERAGNLIQCEPPPGAAETGAPWASPRAIVKALKLFNSALQLGLKGDALFAALAGLIGKEVAGSWLAIRKVRDRVPTVDEIERNPMQAKIPDAADIDAHVGLLGVVAMVGAGKPAAADAAWLYTSRIQSNDFRAATTRQILRYAPVSKDGLAARAKLMGAVGRTLAGR